jgi:hypothetical protein
MCAGLEASPMTANVRGPPRYAPIWTNRAAALPYERNSRLLGSRGRAAGSTDAAGFVVVTAGTAEEAVLVLAALALELAEANEATVAAAREEAEMGGRGSSGQVEDGREAERSGW